MRRRYARCTGTCAGQRELTGEEGAASGNRVWHLCNSALLRSPIRFYKRSFFLPTGGNSGDGRRRILAEAKSFGQFEPERAAVVASQHEHEPAAKTYSGIFSPYR